MRVEEEFEDVLQNIEYAIVQVYRANLKLLDYSVIRALEALIEHYTAQVRQRGPRTYKLSEQDLLVYDAVKKMCEWRLGRPSEDADSSLPAIQEDALSLDELLRCLKRLHQSVKKWNKRGGQQGYLIFIQQFIP